MLYPRNIVLLIINIFLLISCITLVNIALLYYFINRNHTKLPPAGDEKNTVNEIDNSHSRDESHVNNDTTNDIEIDKKNDESNITEDISTYADTHSQSKNNKKSKSIRIESIKKIIDHDFSNMSRTRIRAYKLFHFILYMNNPDHIDESFDMKRVFDIITEYQYNGNLDHDVQNIFNRMDTVLSGNLVQNDHFMRMKTWIFVPCDLTNNYYSLAVACVILSRCFVCNHRKKAKVKTQKKSTSTPIEKMTTSEIYTQDIKQHKKRVMFYKCYLASLMYELSTEIQGNAMYRMVLYDFLIPGMNELDVDDDNYWENCQELYEKHSPFLGLLSWENVLFILEKLNALVMQEDEMSLSDETSEESTVVTESHSVEQALSQSRGKDT